MAYAGATSPAHTGAAVTPTTPIPAGQPGGPVAPANGLAAFANSDMGKMWSQAGQMYGPTKMANYPQAFQGALDAARGSITQMLQGSLADIANSQGKAEEALGQYAPQVNTAWQEGQGNIEHAGNVASGALAGYGMRGSPMAAADMAPEMAAMKATHSNDLSDQALLNTGIQQQSSHDAALAHLAANDRMGQLDQLQAQLSQQAAEAAQAQQNTQANNLQQFGLGMLTHAQDFADQQKLAKANAGSNTNPATGRYANTGLTEGQILGAQKLPEYGRFNSMITSLKAGTPESNTAAGQILQSTSGNPALQQVLMAENPEFFASATPVSQQNTQPNAPSPGVNPYGAPYGSNRTLNTLATPGEFMFGGGRLKRGAERIGSWFNPFG